jgi:hypothetical protein
MKTPGPYRIGEIFIADEHKWVVQGSDNYIMFFIGSANIDHANAQMIVDALNKELKG